MARNKKDTQFIAGEVCDYFSHYYYERRERVEHAAVITLSKVPFTLKYIRERLPQFPDKQSGLSCPEVRVHTSHFQPRTLHISPSTHLKANT